MLPTLGSSGPTHAGLSFTYRLIGSTTPTLLWRPQTTKSTRWFSQTTGFSSQDQPCTSYLAESITRASSNARPGTRLTNWLSQGTGWPTEIRPSSDFSSTTLQPSPFKPSGQGSSRRGQRPRTGVCQRPTRRPLSTVTSGTLTTRDRTTRDGASSRSTTSPGPTTTSKSSAPSTTTWAGQKGSHPYKSNMGPASFCSPGQRRETIWHPSPSTARWMATLRQNTIGQKDNQERLLVRSRT